MRSVFSKACEHTLAVLEVELCSKGGQKSPKLPQHKRHQFLAMQAVTQKGVSMPPTEARVLEHESPGSQDQGAFNSSLSDLVHVRCKNMYDRQETMEIGQLPRPNTSRRHWKTSTRATTVLQKAPIQVVHRASRLGEGPIGHEREARTRERFS